MYIVKSEADYDQILKENDTVFVDFYADWCGPCKMVGPVVEELAADHPEVKFIKVNVDDNSEIAVRYGIMSIPTMILFRKGEVAAKTLGFQPKEALEQLFV